MAKKMIEGIVVSMKIPATAIVEVETAKVDKRYKKRYKAHKKYMSHYENLEIVEGDRVLISGSKPYSKKKRWLVNSVVTKSK